MPLPSILESDIPSASCGHAGMTLSAWRAFSDPITHLLDHAPYSACFASARSGTGKHSQR
jgi:hypothetical protein